MILALVLAGCQCRGEDPPPTEIGDFEVLDEGSGPENEAELLPLHSGTMFAHRHGVVRPPIEIDGQTVARLITQPDSISDESPGSRNESWLAEDATGVWLVGDTQEGMRETPVLVAPTRVREGMRWRTGSRGWTYEVLSRTELDGELGPLTAWLITRDGDRQAYFLYAEGWGQLIATFDEPPDVAVPFLREPVRIIEAADEPAQDTGPLLAMDRVGDDLLESLIRVDSSRAIQHGGQTVIDLQGIGAIFTNGGYEPRYRHAQVTFDGTAVTGGGTIPGTRPPVANSPVEPYYQLGGGGETVEISVGNAYHLGDEVVWTAEELLLWENELGGLNGAYGTDTIGQTDLPLVEPTFGQVGAFRGSTFHPIFGGYPSRLTNPLGRTLLSAEDTPSELPFALVVDNTASLYASHMADYADGRRIEPFTFVEAFPDLLYRSATSPDEDYRGPLHTTSSASDQVHLFVTPGGIVDRIEVDGQGARRVRLGQLDLPPGHSLQAASLVDDDTLVAFTYARLDPFGGPGSVVWTADLSGTPEPVAPPPFVAIDWTGWDARVCWPGATDATIDASTWQLGPSPVAEILPMPGDCVLVVRDFVDGPVPDAEVNGDWPVGWRRVEGELPGIGMLRAYEPKRPTVLLSELPPDEGSVRPDGGAERYFETGPGDGFTFSFDAYGEQVGGPEGFPVPDLGAPGGWVLRPAYERPDAHCGQGCAPEGFWAFVYAGPDGSVQFTRSVLPGPETGIVPARRGGIVTAGALEDTPHTGLILLRTDGSLTDIVTPSGFTPLTSLVSTVNSATDTVCALDGTTLFCADLDGTLQSSTDLPGPLFAAPGPNGWLLLDDTTALVTTGTFGTGEVMRLDLNTHTLLPYPAPIGLSPTGGSVHADGVYYTAEGAWLADGFVALEDIVDVAALSSEPDATIESFLVLGEVVVLRVGSLTLRIPRDAWGIEACEPTTAPGLDADGDGFVAASSCGLDCDDGDAAVNPAAADPCFDSIDSDCDGDPDSGSTCYEDLDADGFAPAGAAAMSACSCPAGWTDLAPTGSNIDCTDEDARAFPGQTEFFTTQAVGATFDGAFDFDCNGVVEMFYSDFGSCSAFPDCNTIPGLMGVTPCGQPGDYLGCLAPGQCGPSCTVDLAGLCGLSADPDLVVTQTCR